MVYLLNKTTLDFSNKVWKQYGEVCPICSKVDSNCLVSRCTSKKLPDNYVCYHAVESNSEFTYHGDFYGGSKFRSRSNTLSTSSGFKAVNSKIKTDNLAPKAFHEEYLQLTKELTLESNHKIDLVKRGLKPVVEHLEVLGFKTIPSNHYFKSNTKLPGFYQNGKSKNATKALLIPCYSPTTKDSLIQGFQYKCDTGTKYLIPSGTYKPHTVEGEIYSTFIPNFNDTSELLVSEGYLKPFVGRVIHNKSFFGFGGGGNRLPIQFSQALAHFKPSETTIVIAPDGGSANNPLIVKTYTWYCNEATRLGFKVKVAFWGQFKDKSRGDIDEISKNNYSLVDFSEFLAASGQATAFKTELPKVTNTVPTKGKHAITDNLLDTYHTVIDSKDIKFVHDISGTGAGKSHTVQKLSVKEGKNLIYAIKSPRNPSVEGIRHKFQLLEGRHDGLYQNELGRLTTRPSGSKKFESNCKFISLFTDLRDKRSSTSGICQKCPLSKDCKEGVGVGYGFMHNYRKAVVAPFIITNPISIPVNKVNENTTIIIDEFTSINSTHEVRVNLMTVMGRAEGNERFEILNFMSTLASGNANTESVKMLATDELVTTLKAIADRENSKLESVNKETMQRMMRDEYRALKNGTQTDLESGLRFVESLEATKLYELLLGGHFSIKGLENNCELLAIKLNQASSESIKKAGTIIVQDATTSTQEIADFFGIDISEIATVELNQESNSTRNIQIKCLGRLTTQRSEKQSSIIERLDKAIPIYLNLRPEQVGYIDYIKYAGNKDLTYFSTARGSNDFAQKKALVLRGLPLPNVGAVLHNYEALTDKSASFDCPEFKAFYARKVSEETIQAIGRLRANRRLDESLTVVVITSDEITSLENIEQVKLKVILPDVNTRTTKRDERIEVATEVIESNQKLTQRLLAEKLGISESAIVKWVKRNYESWESFINALTTQLSEPTVDDTEGIRSYINSLDSDEFKNFIEQLYPYLEPNQVARARAYTQEI